MQSASGKAGEKGKVELTLTKAEIAFLNATIEMMREDQLGRVESVTIQVEPAAAAWKAIIKAAKKVNQWVEKNGGWVAVATAVVDQIFGYTAESSPISREQADSLASFRAAVKRGVSLDELIELRDLIEGQSPKRADSASTSAERKTSKREAADDQSAS